MTTYGAYDANLPCKNPSCKSEGKPHPNCHCYGNMAEGGDVSSFCSEDKDHDSKCEYYKQKDSEHETAGHCAHEGFAGILKNKSNSSKGHKHIDSHCEALFNGGSIPDKDLSKHKKVIVQWLADGGIVRDIQNEIHKHHEGKEITPNANLGLQATKGRISTYLNSLKPQENLPKLAFDEQPDETDQNKQFDKAVHIAAHPLSILGDVKNGTIEPDQVSHLSSMYPELKNTLDKKLTEHITNAQLSGHKPSLKIRQGLGDVLGISLSSEMTPQNIQAAQQALNPISPQQSSQPGQPKKSEHGSKKALSKSDQAFLTGPQALASRSQKQ